MLNIMNSPAKVDESQNVYGATEKKISKKHPNRVLDGVNLGVSVWQQM